MTKFLLAGGKFTCKIYLRQFGFIGNACGPFTKNKESL